MKHCYKILLLMTCLVWACEKNDVTKEVHFDIFADPEVQKGTKSSIPVHLRELNNVDVFIYDSGVLRNSLSFSRSGVGSSSMSETVSLIVGSTYDIVVTANHYEHTAPASLNEALSGLVYRSDGLDTLLENGIPMGGHATVVVTKYTSTVRIGLTRLVADFELEIDVSGLQHGSFSVSSVQVRQMNKVCPFFGTGRAVSPSDVADGDENTAVDLTALNSGWQATFFVLENKQGDLLPGNTNPDNKIPAKLLAAGRNPDLCTYIEVRGVYSDATGSFVAEPVVAKFFLGENACSNFDVNRNWRYNLLLSFTDNICFRNDWKMSCTLSDGRRLGFISSYTELDPGDWQNINLSTNIRYDAGDYYYEVDGDTDYFEIEFDGSRGTFTVTASQDAVPGSAIEIRVATWDEAVSANHWVYIR